MRLPASGETMLTAIRIVRRPNLSGTVLGRGKLFPEDLFLVPTLAEAISAISSNRIKD
jgi:hypothetical protein